MQCGYPYRYHKYSKWLVGEGTGIRLLICWSRKQKRKERLLVRKKDTYRLIQLLCMIPQSHPVICIQRVDTGPTLDIEELPFH